MAYVSETISRVVEVRSLEGEEKFDLVFEDPEGHHHSLLRDKGEHVSRTLKRIVLSSTKSKRVKTGERKHRRVEFQSGGTTPVAVPPLEAHLFTPMGEPVEDNVPNIDAWVEGSVLEVGSISYKVEVNIPKVLSLKLPKFARTMSPIVPEVSQPFPKPLPLCQEISCHDFRLSWNLLTSIHANGNGYDTQVLATQPLTTPPLRY